MPEHHVREIENIAVGLGSLKAMLGMSRIDDSDWENVSLLLDEFSSRLRTSAEGIRKDMGATGNRGVSRERGTDRRCM